jgi:ZIP family zinc transporter/zinc and cadmium transporter
MNLWIWIFLLIAAASNMVGAWFFLLLRQRWEDEALRLLVGTGAGFLLAVALAEMIPRSWELTEHGALWVLGGFLLVHVFQHVLPPHFHYGDEIHTDLGSHVGVTVTSGLAVHSVIDGLAIAVAVQTDVGLGWMVLAAMVWHRVPAGFTVASVVRATGGSAARSMGASAILGVAVILGGAIYMALPGTEWVGPALGLSGGSLIYVGATDLLPEINKRRTLLAPLGVLLGVGVFFAAHFFMGH